MARSRSASGQAEANATRMRVALSMTRAATLSNRRRSVVNSAFCQSGGLRHRLLDAPQQPVGSRVQDQAHLIGIGRAARSAVTGELGSAWG
jgi:hypothetical protein